eukprot:761416-Hanusia_phi.AAC.1
MRFQLPYTEKVVFSSSVIFLLIIARSSLHHSLLPRTPSYNRYETQEVPVQTDEEVQRRKRQVQSNAASVSEFSDGRMAARGAGEEIAGDGVTEEAGEAAGGEWRMKSSNRR